jgi:hypothetical protein
MKDNERIEDNSEDYFHESSLELSFASTTSESSGENIENVTQAGEQIEVISERGIQIEGKLTESVEVDIETPIEGKVTGLVEEDIETPIEGKFTESVEEQCGKNVESEVIELIEEQNDFEEQLESKNNIDDLDLFEDKPKVLNIENFGQSTNIGGHLLYGNFESFPHGIEIRHIYFLVSFGSRSIQVGDLCTDGFIFVGATEVYPKVFLNFSKLNDGDEVLCIGMDEFLSEESPIKLTNKTLSSNGTKTKAICLGAATQKIIEGYNTVYDMHFSASPR